MSTNWSGYRGKHLDFSFFRGGGKMEYLVAAVLGVVIIGAAYFTISKFFGNEVAGASNKLTYKCEQCGYEYEVKLEDLPVLTNQADQVNAMRPDCPSCKASHSCWREMECPNCHKMFVGESEKAMVAQLRTGREDPNRPPDVCPHCGTNIMDWWRQHPRK